MEATNFPFDFGVRRESVFLYMAYSSNQIYEVYTRVCLTRYLAQLCFRQTSFSRWCAFGDKKTSLSKGHRGKYVRCGPTLLTTKDDNKRIKFGSNVVGSLVGAWGALLIRRQGSELPHKVRAGKGEVLCRSAVLRACFPWNGTSANNQAFAGTLLFTDPK